MNNSIANFSYCYGCGVCVATCVHKAIELKLSADGFFLPVVDRAKCVDCGACLRNCSFIDKSPITTLDIIKPLYFAAWSKSSEIRQRCTSGGFCFEAVKSCISFGYKAVVVRYNTTRKVAEHYFANSSTELMESIGSKYVQSYTSQAFSQFTKGEKYIVVGTPCQIDSLRRFFRHKQMEQDVILVDFFCHGVPSYNLLYKYLDEISKIIGEISFLKWRDKSKGWHDSWVMCATGNYGESKSFYSKGDLYYRFFLKNRCLNKACYLNCKYKGLSSSADIRIGDLWGSTFSQDDLGVNGVVVFSNSGFSLIKTIQEVVAFKECTQNVVMESQMKKCPEIPASYNYIQKALQSKESLKTIDKNSNYRELPQDIFNIICYYIKRIQVLHFNK